MVMMQFTCQLLTWIYSNRYIVRHSDIFLKYFCACDLYFKLACISMYCMNACIHGNIRTYMYMHGFMQKSIYAYMHTGLHISPAHCKKLGQRELSCELPPMWTHTTVGFPIGPNIFFRILEKCNNFESDISQYKRCQSV